MTIGCSPWGAVQDRKTWLPGVEWQSTASHGGFVVDTNQFKLAAKLVKSAKFRENGQFYVFEEDCDWAVLLYYHPEVLKAINEDRRQQGLATLTNQAVEDCVRRWNPALLEG